MKQEFELQLGETIVIDTDTVQTCREPGNSAPSQ